MPCFRPLKGYRSRELTDKGKRKIVFNINAGFADMQVEVPCGQCIGCRLERSRQWAIRCVHEAQLHEANSFITLTYNNQNLPKNNSLRLKDFQDFMKRLRKKYGKVRYFHCGEYGEKFQRPHYHVILFGLDFKDKKLHSNSLGNKLYVSESLDKLWQNKGHCLIGDVTFESAAYVARYITKKITGEAAEEHYSTVIPETGEVIKRKPEYITMSRRPGIGKNWLEKFKDDIYPEDFVVIRNKLMKPPKYYDRIYEVEYPDEYLSLKANRINKAELNKKDCTPERLSVREELQLLKFKKLKRGYENED